MHRFLENGHPDMHRFSGIGPTVGGLTGPAITDRNKVNAPFLANFGPTELNKAEYFLANIQGRDGHVTCRFNASGRISVGLRITLNVERKNPDALLYPFGLINSFTGPEFPRGVVSGLAQMPSPDPNDNKA